MTPTRIFDIQEHLLEKYGNRNVFYAKLNGKWQGFDTKNYIKKSKALSLGLLSMDIKKGDKIASISRNRPEWNVLDMAVLQIGAILVPIYPTISDEEYVYIFNHAEVKMVFLSDYEYLERIIKLKPQFKTLEHTYSFDNFEDCENWENLIENGSKVNEENIKAFENIKNEIKHEDLATIIYTSGTTGKAKGVMLSHKNLVMMFTQKNDLHPFMPGHRILSFLPLCHVLERTGNYMYQFHGCEIYYVPDISEISECIKEVKPHSFVTVPRLLERVYDRIMATGKDLSFIKKMIFFWSVNIGLKYNHKKARQPLYALKLKIARALIFSKWKESLGGTLAAVVSGGAALQERIEKVFWAAGIKIQNGYGLTESSPIISANRREPENMMFGSVGTIMNGVEAKIADDGEILARGDNIMMGYYKEPELTKQAIDEEGWLHTGDIGEIIDGRFLKVTDRKKEMFKLSTGKYITPQVIENKIKESIFIEQIIIIGEGQKFTSAIISPNFKFLHDYCSRKKIKYKNHNRLIKIERIIERFQKEIDFYNEMLGQTEKIKKFRLVADEWTPETGELSPTLKLKRRVILNKYKKLISEMYKE